MGEEGASRELATSSSIPPSRRADKDRYKTSQSRDRSLPSLQLGKPERIHIQILLSKKTTQRKHIWYSSALLGVKPLQPHNLLHLSNVLGPVVRVDLLRSMHLETINAKPSIMSALDLDSKRIGSLLDLHHTPSS